VWWLFRNLPRPPPPDPRSKKTVLTQLGGSKTAVVVKALLATFQEPFYPEGFHGLSMKIAEHRSALQALVKHLSNQSAFDEFAARDRIWRCLSERRPHRAALLRFLRRLITVVQNGVKRGHITDEGGKVAGNIILVKAQMKLYANSGYADVKDLQAEFKCWESWYLEKKVSRESHVLGVLFCFVYAHYCCARFFGNTQVKGTTHGAAGLMSIGTVKSALRNLRKTKTARGLWNNVYLHGEICGTNPNETLHGHLNKCTSKHPVSVDVTEVRN
jgi:hypothetical protein